MPTDRTDDAIPQWLIDRPLLYLALAVLDAFPPLAMLIAAYVMAVVALFGWCVWRVCNESF